MSPRTYTSSRDRLLRLGDLGPIFEGQHAMQIFGWSPKTAAHYLWSWAKKGLVKPLGGKSDVFFNLVADPRSANHVEAAIRRAMPGAVVGTRNVLHAAGVTTQRPGQLHLLVRPDERRLSIAGASVETRPASWWSIIDAARAIEPGTAEVLARLRPGAAVADSAASGAFAPDDLDFDELSPAERQRAARLLATFARSRKRLPLDEGYRQVWEKSSTPRVTSS
jgi:hypothetical protein